MDKQKKLNKLKKEKERLSTILLSKRKLAKENAKFMFWTLIFPLLFISSSFIINCIFSTTYTYILLISSFVVYIPSALINLTIAIDGGYKKNLQNRIKYIQSKIAKLETDKTNENKFEQEQARIFLGIEEQSKQEKNWDDVLYTEEEIHQYMQISESPAPFNPETIFGLNNNIEEQNKEITDFRTSIPSSRRFPGYGETQVRCAYSSPTNYKSTRTERDNTKKPGVLYMDLECDNQTECLQQEQSGPVLTKKLTPSRNTDNK